MDNKCIYRLQPFKWFVLENFPFIEADFDSITNYQLLCKVVEYLNKTIDKTNELGNQVEALNNWFNNLDVQDEINNKLDEMAESGELEQIIERYLQTNTIYVYPTVADMKSSTALINGSTVRTLGYYAVNDGGGALYTVTNDGSLNTDDKFVISLQNSLKAQLLYNTEISILQIGAKSQKAGDTEQFDIASYINAYIQKNENEAQKFTLKIPSGIYYMTPLNIKANNFKIIGESTNSSKTPRTVISAMSDQDYIIKLGNFTGGSGYNVIEGITFSSAKFNIDYTRASYYNISQACLIFSYTYFITAKYLAFEYIRGTALNINNSWELWLDKLDFSHINAFNKGVVVFDEVDSTIFGGASNISDSNFDYLRFEQIVGDCIIFKNNCKGLNLHFGTINVEPSQVTDMSDVSFTNYTEGSSIDFAKIDCVVAIEGQTTFIIDNIQVNNLYNRYYTILGSNYIFGDIIQLRNSYMIYQYVINTIALYSAKAGAGLIRSVGNIYDNPRSRAVINNIVNNSNHNMIIPIKEMSKLQLKGSLASVQQDNKYITKNGAMLPCYVNNYCYDTQLRGMINYNENAVNPDKLTIKSTSTLTGVGKRLFGFIFNSLNLVVRAKIAENDTIDVAVYGYNPDTNAYSSLGTSTLTGTGDFAKYDITLSNITKLFGTVAYFQIVNNNESTIIEVDSFSN